MEHTFKRREDRELTENASGYSIRRRIALLCNCKQSNLFRASDQFANLKVQSFTILKTKF